MTSASADHSFGFLLRDWRLHRRSSQMDLALEAGVSPRHVGFLEVGRARPSREMVVRLGNALGLPFREQNDLLLAAGFAPMFRETALSAAAMGQVKAAFEAILRQHEPYPAVVLDRRWNVEMANAAVERIMGRLINLRDLEPPLNLIKLLFDPKGLRPFVKNWETVSAMLVQRIRREAIGGSGDPQAAALLRDIGYAAHDRPGALSDDLAALPVIPVAFESSDLSLSFFSAVTVLGTPQDVTAQELRIECFFPADEATRKTAAKLASENVVIDAGPSSARPSGV